MTEKPLYLTKYITGDTWPALCDQVYMPGERPLDQGGSIFCKTDHLELLQRDTDGFEHEFTLVTGMSDFVIDAGRYAMRPWKATRWFGNHMRLDARGVYATPAGLADARWPHGDLSALEVQYPLTPLADRPAKSVLVCFALETNPKARQKAYEAAQKWPNTTMAVFHNTLRGPWDYREYCAQVAQHQYVLCPWGNGYDCCRMWEAMYLGAIPIVLRHPTLSSFTGFWMVDEWPEQIPELETLSLMVRKPELTQDIRSPRYWAKMIGGGTPLAKAVEQGMMK